jgi:hypothetical protein
MYLANETKNLRSKDASILFHQLITQVMRFGAKFSCFLSDRPPDIIPISNVTDPLKGSESDLSSDFAMLSEIQAVHGLKDANGKNHYYGEI